MTHVGSHCGGLGEPLGTKLLRIGNYSRFNFDMHLVTDGLTDEQIEQAFEVMQNSQNQLYYDLHNITGDEIQYTPADHEPYPKAGDPDIVALCEGDQGEDEQ